jgi:hypothetical protein
MATTRRTTTKKRASPPKTVRKVATKLEKPVQTGSDSAHIDLGDSVRLPLSPKRPERERQRRVGPVSLDRRFKKQPAYHKAIKRLLIKVAHLVKRGDQYKIPLSEEKEVVDYVVKFTFQFRGKDHNGKFVRRKIEALVRVLSLEIEAAANESDYQTNLLARAYRHVWFGPAYQFFRSGGIRMVHLHSLRVDRMSLSDIRGRERSLRKSGRRGIRKDVGKDPRFIFGKLRAGKKYYPRGITGGEVWAIEPRRLRGKRRLVVVQKFYRKDGKKSTNRRNNSILWKPEA